MNSSAMMIWCIIASDYAEQNILETKVIRLKAILHKKQKQA